MIAALEKYRRTLYIYLKYIAIEITLTRHEWDPQVDSPALYIPAGGSTHYKFKYLVTTPGILRQGIKEFKLTLGYIGC